ncbi:MAG: heme ABC exporter ATP-binding protein CcmA [Marinicaulis sp.]|nr:heme ABC exporter ATP-binding protein CcmA [Marinicaulis sp.]
MATYLETVSLRAENVGCDRGGLPIVRGVDLALAPGEAVQLFGANGAGKSSLLNLFAGHLRVAEGSISWGVDDEWSPGTPANQLVYIGHEIPVKLALTASENLTFWAKTYGVGPSDLKDLVRKALSRVGMIEHADLRAGRLSAGQRRRLDIARAGIAKRPVWLMDEPAAAIDDAGEKIVSELITNHLEHNGIAIIATHDSLDVVSQRLVIG